MVSAATLDLFWLWFQMWFWSCFGCGFDYDFGLVLDVVLDAVLGLILLWFWTWCVCGFDCNVSTAIMDLVRMWFCLSSWDSFTCGFGFSSSVVSVVVLVSGRLWF